MSSNVTSKQWVETVEAIGLKQWGGMEVNNIHVTYKPPSSKRRGMRYNIDLHLLPTENDV